MVDPTMDEEARAREAAKKAADREFELTKLQLDYAWKWFAFHAEQRTKMFNFMLVTAGVLAAAVATAVKSTAAHLAIALCLAGAVLALIFSRLDRRNRDLVWKGEDVLIELEKTAVFREGRSITDHFGKSAPFAILASEIAGSTSVSSDGATAPGAAPCWQRVKNELGLKPDEKLTDAIWSGKHRVLNPLIAVSIAILFVAMAIIISR